MNRELAGLVAAMAMAGGAMAQDAVQWRIEEGGNGHWYARIPTPGGVSWSIASAAAIAAGGHLVSITSAAENARLVALGAQAYDLLGANTAPSQGCMTNTWTWHSGEPWSYTNWAQYEPSLHCDETVLVFAANQFPKWNNFYGGSNGYWLEWDADCNGDGTVDLGQIRSGELADANANNIPDCCEAGHSCAPCPADIVQDNAVNGVDLAAVINAWGTDGGKLPRSDVDGNGIVDGADLAQVLGSWGPCP